MARTHPHLYEHLTATEFDDGGAREVSGLTIFVDDGVLKVALNDRSEQRSAYVTADTVGEALDTLERQLAEDMADWRRWRTQKRKK